MKKLNQKVEQMLYEKVTDFEIAKIIKDDIKQYFHELPNIFASTGGKDFLLRHTQKIDNIVKLVYKVAFRNIFGDYAPMKNSFPVAIAALGSYGREQLCVHSDIDLMLVYEPVDGYQPEEFIQRMLYLFWDTGLKLGHRVHTLSELPEVARGDITIKSAILESRFVEGSRFLWTGVENKITQMRKEEPALFIKAKIEEQQALHLKFPLTMEPNLKEGVGGFRDANLVFWIGKLLYDAPRIKDLPQDVVEDVDYRQFRIALEFLFRLRSALHLVYGTKEDRLRLERIPEVASLLGYDSTPHAQMRLAKKTTQSLRTINMFGKIWMEKLVSGVLPGLYEGYFETAESSKLSNIINLLNARADTPYTVHPRTLKILLHANKPSRLTKILYASISKIFHKKHSHSVLLALHGAGLLGYIIPPMRKVENLPQFDGYHAFSVDIHSLECLRYLETIEDTLLRQRYESLSKKEKHLLKVVVFLHDAGKGRRKDHHIVGTYLFRLFAQKIGMDEKYIEMGTLLVRHHDMMSRVAQREDLYNEKTILNFASYFNSHKLLDMIYLLTYADMNGVGEGIYTQFSARLLCALYDESLKVLDNKKVLDITQRKLKQIDKLKRNKLFMNLTRMQQKKILSICSDELFVHSSVAQILAIADMSWEVVDIEYKVTNDKFLTIEIARVGNMHLGYLLDKLSRLNIVNLNVYKLFGELKYFRIDFSEIVEDDELPLIKQMIQEAYRYKDKLKLTKPNISSKDIEIDCNHSREYGALRLQTQDQKGLLAFVIEIFDRIGIDIVSTKIHTSKYRANDLFLIQKDGNFCNNIDKIIKELTE